MRLEKEDAMNLEEITDFSFEFVPVDIDYANELILFLQKTFSGQI